MFKDPSGICFLNNGSRISLRISQGNDFSSRSHIFKQLAGDIALSIFGIRQDQKEKARLLVVRKNLLMGKITWKIHVQSQPGIFLYILLYLFTYPSYKCQLDLF